MPAFNNPLANLIPCMGSKKAATMHGLQHNAKARHRNNEAQNIGVNVWPNRRIKESDKRPMPIVAVLIYSSPLRINHIHHHFRSLLIMLLLRYKLRNKLRHVGEAAIKLSTTAANRFTGQTHGRTVCDLIEMLKKQPPVLAVSAMARSEYQKAIGSCVFSPNASLKLAIKVLLSIWIRFNQACTNILKISSEYDNL